MSQVEQTDLASLVNHRETIDARRTLDEVYQWYQSHGQEFCAVMDESRLLGICSRARLGFLMAHRYGFAIYSKQRVTEHLVAHPLILKRGTPIRLALEATLGRIGQEFNEDVALTDDQGEYLGMISVPTFVRLQSALVEERFALQELLYERLMTASREAGKAEIATGVLHNVGNVLNSVNIAAGVVMELLRLSKIPSLQQAAEMLNTNQGDRARFLTEDPRGRLLPDFLVKVAARLGEERGHALGELQGLVKHIDHIKQIVAMQQSYARAMGIRESVAVASIVEDALKMNDDSFNRGHIQLARSFAPAPRVVVDRHKVLLILTNLLRNARQAVEAAPEERRKIEVAIEETESGDVAVSVRDYGVGIAAQNMNLIFTHGFTTKAGGHGFGLHSSALVARELGGSLRAQSDGVGCGATFTLELPVEKVRESQAFHSPDLAPEPAEISA